MRVGNTLMMVGAAIAVIGALFGFAPGLFVWFGRLPGDISIEGESSRVFIPITSKVVVSVFRTLAVSLLATLFRSR